MVSITTSSETISEQLKDHYYNSPAILQFFDTIERDGDGRAVGDDSEDTAHLVIVVVLPHDVLFISLMSI